MRAVVVTVLMDLSAEHPYYRATLAALGLRRSIEGSPSRSGLCLPTRFVTPPGSLPLDRRSSLGPAPHTAIRRRPKRSCGKHASGTYRWSGLEAAFSTCWSSTLEASPGSLMPPTPNTARAAPPSSHCLPARFRTRREIDLTLWRPVLPDGRDDPEGRHFQSVGVARPGYFRRPPPPARELGGSSFP
jgi:hypothetical protein